jgi:hypothetical protein
MNVNKKTIKIWEKNLKQGYRFFQPHNAYKPLPRTLREAFDHKIYQEIKNEEFILRKQLKLILLVLLFYY